MEKIKIEKIDSGTTIRTVILAIAIINQLLVSLDLYIIPGSSEQQKEFISTVVLGIAAVWAWFKNNYVTLKGQKQKEVLREKGLG